MELQDLLWENKPLLVRLIRKIEGMCFFSNEMSLLYVPASAEISWTKSYILDAALWLWSYSSGCWQYSQGLVYTFKKTQIQLNDKWLPELLSLNCSHNRPHGWTKCWVNRKRISNLLKVAQDANKPGNLVTVTYPNPLPFLFLLTRSDCILKLCLQQERVYLPFPSPPWWPW